jgi:hypothetical protein
MFFFSEHVFFFHVYIVPNTHSTLLLEVWHVNIVLHFQKSLAPSLPEDLAISFYIQSHKLIFAVYQLSSVHGTMKFDSHQAECSVPWLNEVLVLFTVALQLCQQLKDKVMPLTWWTYTRSSILQLALHSLYPSLRSFLMWHTVLMIPCARCTGAPLHHFSWNVV